MGNKKLALIILDGWGIGDQSSSDAIYHASTPFYNALLKKYPNATLRTDGELVGLPMGQMGNSEVGHLNLGAGRIVYQDLVRINLSIQNKQLENNKVLEEAIAYAKSNNVKVHLMGLVSNGGVHSHLSHLYALIEILEKNGCHHNFIHAFTDGRDCDPKSGLGFLRELERFLQKKDTRIASIIGRYYAMDRDNRWERTKKAYDLLVSAEGEKYQDPISAIKNSYEEDITDEFIEPICITDEHDNALARIKDGDLVICFNFRTDRCRQITTALTQRAFEDPKMRPLDLNYITMTEYDKNFRDVKILFEKDHLKNTLGEVIANNDLQQLRIAETEKYPHVTFFFSGGREKEFRNERRILLDSPKVATYDLQPEMSAAQITEAVIKEIKDKGPDFICLNFANPDMVGHTGVYPAIIKAVETVDSCTEKIVESGLENGYSFIILADHGNADYAVNEDNTPNTAHTTNPVPVILLDKDYSKIENGKLADIAPSILKLMGIEIPEEMTGKVLIQ